MSAQVSPPRHPLTDLLTVMWHYVRDPGDEPQVGAGRVDPTTFDQQLDRLARERTIVAWADVVDALDGQRPLPSDAALLTFDDGLADHERVVAPRLVARGLSGVFFTMARRPGERLTLGHRLHIVLADLSVDDLRTVIRDRLSERDRVALDAAEARELAAGRDPLDALKRPLQRELADAVDPILGALIRERHGSEADLADALHLSPGQLSSMRREGQVIGGHGRRHLWFDHVAAADVADEIAVSAAFLADDRGPWPFAYPYGASSPGAAALLERSGFGAAFHASPREPFGRSGIGRVDAETGELDQALDPSRATKTHT